MSDDNHPPFFRSLRFRYGGYFLWAEHQAHIIGYLPLILILGLCGGMHFFMHGGHGGHGNGKDHEDTEK